MSSDADAHKVGLIPVTLMVSGILWGQVFSVTCKPGLHWRDCHLWMVGDDYRCAGALDGIRQNVVPRPKSWWFLRLRPPLLWPVSRLSNQRPLLAGLLDR